jgi:hypothetical protein
LIQASPEQIDEKTPDRKRPKNPDDKRLQTEPPIGNRNANPSYAGNKYDDLSITYIYLSGLLLLESSSNHAPLKSRKAMLYAQLRRANGRKWVE